MPVPNDLKEKGGVAKPGVAGTGETKILIDQEIPTDRAIKHRRPDLVVRVGKEKRVVIYEVACAWDPLVKEREDEKKAKYQELADDLAKQCPGYKVTVVPVVLDDLGTIKGLKRHLTKNGLLSKSETEAVVPTMQRETLCATVKIIKRHMTTY